MNRYALISDIHGNLPALLAVLEDAQKHGVDHYLLLGDYVEDFPWPNEIVRIMQGLENAVMIRGNKEEYLANMQGEDQTQWVYEQMAPMYWNYRALTAEHLDYLVALPASAEVQALNGVSICLSHQEPAQEIAKMPLGVYIFGHSHIQSSVELEGRWYINPGSCGMPMDSVVGASYTILEHEAGYWKTIERRVLYDTEAAVQALVDSELYAQAEIWSKIMIQQLRTGNNIINPFLHHAQGLAREQGCPAHPISNELWREAAATFEGWR